ncbi:MAG TPA: TPM domain-containing protein [Pyrinomonadaceae bacterium]|nr:TPM domain-containing protein [Pyrinomonadaceae bacterium]
MSPSYRVIKRLLTVIPAGGLFLLISANPFAQSTKLPAPSGHVNDFAGVIDSETKARLENLLQRLQEKSKFELYIATVESTGAQEISAFSNQLARDWSIGTQTTKNKSLLLVVSTGTKTSFARFSRAAQVALPDGVLGEMTYRMQTPLGEGRFAEAVNSGVYVFANAVAEKIGFKVSDLESPVAATTAEVATDSPQPVRVSATNVQKTRPRVVSDSAKPTPQSTPPAEPKTEPTPTETPTTEPTPTESPKVEPTSEPKSDPTPSESPKTEAEVVTRPTIEKSNTTRVKPTAAAAKTKTPVVKKTPEQIKEDELDEIDEVELTLTKPLPERAVKLKQFLDAHPTSVARPRAVELLISTHAALGDQQLKDGDTAGGIGQLLRAIDEADVSITDKLFSGVIAQIPTNLYMRGERDASFRAAQKIETKFGSNPKRLLDLANFYLGVERSSDTVRLGEAAVKLAPDLAEAHRILAIGYHLSLRLDEAATEYKKTLELDPKSKVSRGSLADLYRASGKTEDALALYNEQLAADPKDRAARAGKVISLLELSRTDEANSTLEAAFASDQRNLPLLAGTAYWFAAHEDYPKAFELARRAIAIEPRYTWAQIALSHAYLGLKSPLDAERAIRFARQYGKFPTLSYELANVLASMGLYDEAIDALNESFTIKDDQIEAYLAGTVPVRESGFIELLAPERRASIYQRTSADNAANAKRLKALLAFSTAVKPGENGKINEAAAVDAAKEFAGGTDSMRAFRQMYAANHLLRNGVGATTALEFIADARKATDEALKVPVLTLAVQAEEYRDMRASAISNGNVPDVAPAPAEVLANIYKGRLEDLEGWALFNQEKYPEAMTHLKQASETLPAQTPAWRNALWHLGVALEQSGQKEQALDAYIKSYSGGRVESVRRSVIEKLYKRINGSLDGLDKRIGEEVLGSNTSAPTPTTTPEATTTTPAQPAATPEATPAETLKPETPKPETETPKSEPTPTPAPAAPESTQPTSDESLKNAASRLRSTIRITGRVVDARQNGIGNVAVILISPSNTVLATTTDNDGYYSFKVAPSQKTYRVIPSKEGYTFTPIDRSLPTLFEDLRAIDFVGKP